jgi:hypothetical protein
MANPSDSSVQNLLPVQAYFDVDGNFQTFIGQGQPFTAIIDPDQSGLHITDSTIDSTPIGATTPSTGAFTSGTVAAAPSAATDIANKQYVDYYAAGLSWKQPVKAASLSNIATLSGFQTIDAVPLTEGDRVLVKDQSLSKDNGIYIVHTGAWTYAVGADDWEEYVGAIVFVEEGSQAYSAWYSLAQEGGTLGVTALDWANFSVSSTYSAGTGLTLAGGVFSITNTGVINATYGSASKTVTLAINAQGQATSASQQDIAIAATQITSGTVDSARLSGVYSGITGLGTLTDLTVTNPISGSVTGSSATSSKATNIAGGLAGYLPYQTAVDTTSFVVPGSNGNILTLVDGVPAWAAAPSTGVTSFSADSTGLTPATSTTGAVTLGGTLNVASGGTGAGTAGDARTNLGAAASGANGDITSMTGLTGGIITPDFVTFDVTPETVPTATGSLYWDSADSAQTLSLVMEGGNAIQQIGQETYFRIKCSAAITEGQVVMFTGTVGSSGGLTGAPATGLTAATASYIMGVATESGALNDWIYVTSFGLVRGINTTGGAEAWVDGQILYYNPAVTGGLTKTLPSAPNAKVQVCAVVHADANGSLFIRPAFGGELGQYEGDVQVTTPANGDLLIRNQTSGKWVNAPLTAGTNVTITNSAGGVTIAAAGGLTVTDDTSTNATRYLTFTSATSGSITGINTSSTKLKYNPSTGALDLSGGTSGLSLPTGTTAQRPSATNAGEGLRWNTTTNAPEIYTGSTNTWQQLVVSPYSYSLNYLIVAGGGGANTGGGGAGGMLTGSGVVVSPGTSYTITIGAGGSGYSNGSNSTALGFTAIGGGYGGGNSPYNGNSGGSGGGGGQDGGSTSGSGGAGTSGQGNSGGSGTATPGNRAGGGGGGAGAAGQSANARGTGYGGVGGDGLQSSINGTATYYAGGGGGYSGYYANVTAPGGLGGGGTGSASQSGGGSAGSANTGGGGGGAYSGGSGIVIISYLGNSQKGTGGTVTTYGSGSSQYYVHTFTTSGTFIS